MEFELAKKVDIDTKQDKTIVDTKAPTTSDRYEEGQIWLVTGV